VRVYHPLAAEQRARLFRRVRDPRGRLVEAKPAPEANELREVPATRRH
jgi:hypothetical protein